MIQKEIDNEQEETKFRSTNIKVIFLTIKIPVTKQTRM